MKTNLTQTLRGITFVSLLLASAAHAAPTSTTKAITVTHSTQTSPSRDNTIMKQVKKQFLKNKTTEIAKLSIVADNGIVTLVGTVSSSTEALALIDIVARTADVKDVDVGGLKVLKSRELTADDYTTAKVTSVLANAKFLTHTSLVLPIKVTTRSGAVTLEGTVQNQLQKVQTEQTVAALKGVTQVVTKLKVVA